MIDKNQGQDPTKNLKNVPVNPLTQPMPKTEADKSPFSPMLQGTGSNRLSQISTRSTLPDVDAVTGVATISSGDFKVFIERYNKLTGGLRVSTHKLLDVCAIALTQQNGFRTDGDPQTAVTIPLEAYVRMLGKPFTKSTIDEVRKRVKEDLETLYNVSIEWSERNGKSVKDYSKMRVVSSQGIKRGNIHVGFSPEFAKYLTGAYIMQYPTDLLKIDERNASSYHVGRKLLLHFSMHNNQKKGTANIISVRSLLSVCPEIPSRQVVANSDRHIDRRIRAPLEDALNALGFITWKYLDAKGDPLPSTPLGEITYKVYEGLFVQFTIKNFPSPKDAMESDEEDQPLNIRRETATKAGKKVILCKNPSVTQQKCKH